MPEMLQIYLAPTDLVPLVKTENEHTFIHLVVMCAVCAVVSGCTGYIARVC